MQISYKFDIDFVPNEVVQSTGNGNMNRLVTSSFDFCTGYSSTCKILQYSTCSSPASFAFSIRGTPPSSHVDSFRTPAGEEVADQVTNLLLHNKRRKAGT